MFLAEFSRRLYNLSRGVDSLSQEEHGRFFEIAQRLGLPNEVKQAAVVLYLDFKSRPIGEYNSEHKGLDVFLIASISLAAKIIGDFRTDQEFESRMILSRERLVDAEERIMRSFGVQDSVVSFSELVMRLTKRQIESMAEHFEERGLVRGTEREQLIQLSLAYLDEALEKGLTPKMSYRGRASGVVLKAVRELGFHVSEIDIARAAGFDKRGMAINADIIDSLLKDSKESARKQTRDSQIS